MGNKELQPSPFGSFMVMIKEQPVWLEDKGQKLKSLEKSKGPKILSTSAPIGIQFDETNPPPLPVGISPEREKFTKLRFTDNCSLIKQTKPAQKPVLFVYSWGAYRIRSIERINASSLPISRIAK